MDAREPRQGEEAPGRPVLVFDGECGFCTGSVLWLLPRLARPVAAVPWQRLAEEGRLGSLGLSERDVERYAWWVEGGRRDRGHRAAARALLASRRPWPALGAPLLVPPVSWLAAAGYRAIAFLRRWLPGRTPACRRARWPP